jgi:hypothetical protein
MTKNYLLHIAQSATALQRTYEEYISKNSFVTLSNTFLGPLPVDLFVVLTLLTQPAHTCKELTPRNNKMIVVR